MQMRSPRFALPGASPSSSITALVSEYAVTLGDRPLLNISALSQTTGCTRRRNSVTMVRHLPLVGSSLVLKSPPVAYP
jgi:hypothetical protein